MSMICIGVIRANPAMHHNIKELVSQVLECAELGLQFEITWEEPALNCLDAMTIVFSISDTPLCDSCEMLFLADGCFFNDKENTIPLLDRMQVLQDIALKTRRVSFSVEYYIGTSGTMPEEYIEYYVADNKIAALITNKLHSNDGCRTYPLHIVIQGQEGGL